MKKKERKHTISLSPWLTNSKNNTEPRKNFAKETLLRKDCLVDEIRSPEAWTEFLASVNLTSSSYHFTHCSVLCYCISAVSHTNVAPRQIALNFIIRMAQCNRLVQYPIPFLCLSWVWWTIQGVADSGLIATHNDICFMFFHISFWLIHSYMQWLLLQECCYTLSLTH